MASGLRQPFGTIYGARNAHKAGVSIKVGRVTDDPRHRAWIDVDLKTVEQVVTQLLGSRLEWGEIVHAEPNWAEIIQAATSTDGYISVVYLKNQNILMLLSVFKDTLFAARQSTSTFHRDGTGIPRITVKMFCKAKKLRMISFAKSWLVMLWLKWLQRGRFPWRRSLAQQ